MNKFFTSSIALLLCASANADSIKFLSAGEGVPGRDIPQLQGLGISPNGLYVCGAGEGGAAIFVANTETGKVTWSAVEVEDGGELRHVDNNGTAIGFTNVGITYSFQTGEATEIAIPDDYRGLVAEDLTEDGSMIVGSLSSGSFTTYASYKKEGSEWALLANPTEEELGAFNLNYEGSAAKLVSGDGKVIFGFLGSFTIPTVWVANETGEYETDFFPARFLRRGPDDNERELESLSAMYLSLSNNGKYAAMVGLIVDEETNKYLNIPVIYDIENRELKIYKGRQAIDPDGRGIYPCAICDDGTFIGTVGQPYFNACASFIMKAGETEAELFETAFPAFDKKLSISDNLGFSIPDAISADGRYISGFAYYSDDFYDATLPAYYVTYVIDTKDDSGVEAITSENADVICNAIYNLEGQRVNKLNKGINIIRMSDGTTKKVMVK